MSAAERRIATLRVSGGLSQAVSASMLRTLPGEVIAEFLDAQRWFGKKAHPLVAVRIAEVIPVSWSDGTAAVVRLEVDPEDQMATSYQLPLIARSEDEMARENGGSPNSDAVLANVEANGTRGVIMDALHDARFRARLGDTFAAGARMEGEGAAWTLEPVGSGPGEIGELPSRLSPAEQSNTSVIYGDRAILKLFRKLEPGIHPDVEIVRFLTTRTSFRHTPELLGAIELRRADGSKNVAGMLSRFLPGATDGWKYALELLRPYLRAEGKGEPPNPFTIEAEQLGAITRELHDALASDPSIPGFETRSVTAEDVDRWAREGAELIDDALTLLSDRLSSLDGRVLPMARAIAGRRAAALDRLAEAVSAARHAVGTGRMIRHHGDYHLGQVLRKREGEWMIIDFEGEPTRPLASRRALSSPARDVAGMLRSFAYAAATGVAEAGGLGVNPRLEIRSAHWERAARSAFLSAYGPELDEPLVTLFELEKVFYELRYELNHRPEWVWIPLRGIAKIF
jgi:maltose alpha-D-glucosyltransferase/alpha-amylase